MGSGGPHNWVTVTDNPSGKAIYNGVALVRPGHKYGLSSDRTIPMLAVLPPAIDSSSGGQCWADTERWGPLSGTMIHTSYSRCCMIYILTQNLEPHPNGFAVQMPFLFKSGVMRTRVNPADGQVYVVGQKGWDTTARDRQRCRREANGFGQERQAGRGEGARPDRDRAEAEVSRWQVNRTDGIRDGERAAGGMMGTQMCGYRQQPRFAQNTSVISLAL
jgi:hypothetical protein